MSQDNNGHGPDSRPQRAMFDQDAQGGKPVAEHHREEERTAATGESAAKKAAEQPASTRVHTSKQTQQRRKKQKRRRKITAIVAISLVVVLVGAIVAGIVYVWSNLSGEGTHDGVIPDELTTANIPEYTGKGLVCGLVAGIDYNNEDASGFVEGEDKIGNTDLILYVMFDTDNGKANIMQIPRDVFVGEEASTGGVGRMNALYRNAEDPDNRMAALAQVLYDQLKLPVDFYITIDMDAVKAIVDHMGAIEVYVSEDMDNDGSHISAGWQNLTSAEVEFFLRNRKQYGDQDISRLRNQQYFYSALFREFKRLTPTDLVIWMRILLYYVNVGGLDLVQVGGLAQKALALDGSDIVFVRPPVVGSEYKGQDVLYLVPDKTADILNEYFRPNGMVVPVEELDIHTLTINKYGESPAEVRTMAGIQEQEPPK